MTVLFALALTINKPARAQDESKNYDPIRAERAVFEARRQACPRAAAGDRARADACLDAMMADAGKAADAWIAQFNLVFAKREGGAALVRGVLSTYAAMRTYRSSFCWVAGAASLAARPGAIDKFAEAECYLNQTYWFVPDVEIETKP